MNLLQKIPREPDSAAYFCIIEMMGEGYITEDDNGKFGISVSNRANFGVLAGTLIKALNKSHFNYEGEIFQLNFILRKIHNWCAGSDDMKRLFEIQMELAGKQWDAQSGEQDSFETETFTLPENDTLQVVQLTGEIRTIVSESDQFDLNHKRRLIKRINLIEIEAFKSNGRFDTILAGMSEFGETLEKFGNDVKPAVERMKEIKDIFKSRTGEQKRLPSTEEQKRLPPPNEETEVD